MINKQFQCEDKISYQFKCCYIHKELYKFQGQFDLEGQGKGHQFLNPVYV